MTASAEILADIYLRMSLDAENDEKGVDRQEVDCRKLCTRNGWTVRSVIRENDTSAYRGKRPKYEQLLEDIEQGTVTAVVAYHQKRLIRRKSELEHFMDVVGVKPMRCKVAFVASSDFDFETSAGRLQARIIGDFALSESEEIGERVARKKDELAGEGKPSGGPRAYGYNADNMTIDKTEARVFKSMVDRFLTGDSLSGIATDLNQRGIPTKGNTLWTASAVRTMLLNPRYAGLRVHRGEIVGKAAWKPIIDRTTHERLVKIITDPNKRKRNPSRRAILTGLVRCGRCGSPMGTDFDPRRKRILRCKRTARYLERCGSTVIQYEETLDHVAKAVIAAVDTGKFHGLKAAAAKVQRHETDEEIDIAALEARLDQFDEMLAAGDIDQKRYAKVYRAVTHQLEEARAAIVVDDRHGDLLATLGTTTLREQWEIPAEKGGFTDDQRRTWLMTYLDAVEISEVGNIRNRYDVNRVSLRWRDAST